MTIGTVDDPASGGEFAADTAYFMRARAAKADRADALRAVR
jgi:hypothetical protein